MPNGDESLSKIFAVAREANVTAGAVLEAVSEETGWTIGDLEALTDPNGLNLSLPDAFRDERALRGLVACFGMMKRLGVSAENCLAWREADMDDNGARSIKETAKAKYDNEQWLAIAKPLNDVLREKKRAALVSYLVTHPELDAQNKPLWKDANGLYQHFLIDVEISACMMTSRIKQAVASVQLFIQRCLMNLETEAGPPIPEDNWDTYWKWMKNYRVWEANRKVFLWPENWIEPELRDDKSAFFKDLEGDLLQNEVTSDTAEVAFLNYLEKLDQVASLDIVGMYHQLEKAADGKVITNILHVFGRTPSEPHIYYYRKRIDSAYWTAWERVDADIQSDHLIPIVWNRRLYLFWPIFAPTADENQPIPDANTPPADKAPSQLWEIKLAWSEYRNGKWSGKRVSPALQTDVFTRNSLTGGETSQLFYFFADTSDTASHTSCDIYVCLFDGVYYLKKGMFSLGSSNSEPTVESIPGEPLEDLLEIPFPPTGTEPTNMQLVETVDSGDVFQLPNGRRQETDILARTREPETFRLLLPHQLWPEINVPFPIFFYRDDKRTFFVELTIEPVAIFQFAILYKFETFYHPYVFQFIKQLNRFGVDGLLAPPVNGELPDLLHQQIHEDSFFDEYGPNENAVMDTYPEDDVDVEFGGAYSVYNWELFFHAPLLIADRLSKNQRFEDAQKWFHYIFDPTSGSNERGLERFWNFRKFYEDVRNGRIETLDDLMRDERELEKQVEQWRLKPFNPHLIARMRIEAYPKTVVMKYIDNLIAWGDQLFRRDTIESINEATLLYVLAAEILGPRPEIVPEQRPQNRTFNQLLALGLNAFSNALVEIENLLPLQEDNGGIVEDGPDLPSGDMWYFCIPPNEKLLGYWDTVVDRLFKIRHCMTIEGVVRQLPLFEPPIEPGLLVRAAAAGVDVSSALNDINAALPHYRFNVMLQKAAELCNDVKVLGAALLAAIEKRDAEELALLRSSHEMALLDAVRQIKEKQADEAAETHESLNRALEVTRKRSEYYNKLKTEFAPDGLSPNEVEHLAKLRTAKEKQEKAMGSEEEAQWASLIPNATFGTSGWAGSPVVTATVGGNLLVLKYQSNRVLKN